MEEKTIHQYQQVISHCRELFEKKAKDYGTAWRIMRMPSITDQIYIKINRIRSIQDKGMQQINEAIEDEFVAIINYSIIAMVQLGLAKDERIEIPAEELMELYDKYANETLELLQRKNHDYGEAWRDMRVSSITDIILMKVYRVKQIEDNEGQTLVSEGVSANYQDMLNYSVFALILSGFVK
ncbi:DUF1599 domain-containing protein [Mangrovivirga cuniculi]|uniref:Nucleotide modification associated domain-containing protein n=1 Tax=Mangrovivirga cuniculi TaxID=2715131 RepID=A0A4D7JLK4_9BACT|nr:DUF1599 domain-containing protein [Mangrovivirga cuniculi]QCK16471.1 hypothetical protein DCC35_17920 [Mangrovivirga cuniculi]